MKQIRQFALTFVSLFLMFGLGWYGHTAYQKISTVKSIIDTVKGFGPESLLPPLPHLKDEIRQHLPPIPSKIKEAIKQVKERHLRMPSMVMARQTIGNKFSGYSAYDAHFRAAVFLYWPPPVKEQWDKLLAQCKVESGLKTDAESPVGAVGVCQFMPGTWKDWLKVNKNLGKDRRDAVSNINAAAWYMAKMLQFWYAPRAWECREELAWASYNWGAGNVHNQQKKYGGACLADFGHDLPEETRNYVKRIRETWIKLRG